MRRPFVPLLVIVIALFAAACGGGGDNAADRPDTSTTTTEATIGGVHFRNGGSVELAAGWALSPCESGPPLFCARAGGETRGVVELNPYPVASLPAVRDALARGASPVEAAGAHGEEFLEIFEEDRPKGCGPGYEVTRFGPRPATVAGLPGVVYGFDGAVDGRRVERVVQFAALRGDTLFAVAFDAVEDGSCMDDGELVEFTVADLARLEPTLAKVIAASSLP